MFLWPAFVTTLLAAASPEVMVRWADTHQRITGVGGSGGNDSAANFQKLTPENQQRLCDLLFDVKKGIGLTMVRNEIYAWKIQPTPGTLDWTKDNDQVWLMRQAKSRGATNFWSAVWSPPVWMKSNGILTNGGSLLREHSQAYADLLARYVREYKSRFDLDISAVSISNEPEVKQSYQSTVWSGEEMRDFIRDHLGPTFRKEGLPTAVIVPENCTWDHLAQWADVILADPGARDFVSIIAAHQYDQSYTGSVPKFPPSTLETAYPPAKANGKELWQTEVSFIGGKPDPGNRWGLGTALLIHNAMVGAEVNAWVWWALLNDWKDNEGLADLAGDSFIVNKRLWAFGNFSRFVRPGWVMIGTSGAPATNVFVSAFKDPSSGRFALVAINNTEAEVTLQTHFEGFSCGTLTPWVTDAALDLAEKPAVKGSASGLQLPLGPSSVTTFVGASDNVKAQDQPKPATTHHTTLPDHHRGDPAVKAAAGLRLASGNHGGGATLSGTRNNPIYIAARGEHVIKAFPVKRSKPQPCSDRAGFEASLARFAPVSELVLEGWAATGAAGGRPEVACP
jgi:glucuronoarabinoxylan endo-1,4-beta-xylanase